MSDRIDGNRGNQTFVSNTNGTPGVDAGTNPGGTNNPPPEGGDDYRSGSVSSDPRWAGLSVDAKVQLLLTLLIKEQDEEIEGQIEKIEDLQAAEGGQASADGAEGTEGPDAEKPEGNLDVELVNLDRMMTMRGITFDSLKGTLETYDQSASRTANTIGVN